MWGGPYDDDDDDACSEKSYCHGAGSDAGNKKDSKDGKKDCIVQRVSVWDAVPLNNRWDKQPIAKKLKDEDSDSIYAAICNITLRMANADADRVPMPMSLELIAKRLQHHYYRQVINHFRKNMPTTLISFPIIIFVCCTDWSAGIWRSINVL